MGFKGYHHTKEARLRIGRAQIGNKHAIGNTWSRGKIGLENEKNPAWKGINASYVAKHQWIRRKAGKADHCDSPACRRKCSKFEWALKNNYQYDKIRKRYIQLCKVCHCQYDFYFNSFNKDKLLKLSKLSNEDRKKLLVKIIERKAKIKTDKKVIGVMKLAEKEVKREAERAVHFATKLAEKEIIKVEREAYRETYRAKIYKNKIK